MVSLAKREKRILLTHDQDFALTLRFPPKNFEGILIFRGHPPRFEQIKTAADNFWARHSPARIKGKTFLIEERTFLELVE